MVHARDFSEGVARTDPVVAMLARFFLNRGIFFFHDGRRKADVILGISVIRKIEEFGRIQRDFADAHFKMEMWPRRTTCVAAKSNDFAGFDRLADFDELLGKMGVDRPCDSAVFVFDDNVTAVATTFVTDSSNASWEGRTDSISTVQPDIDAFVNAIASESERRRDATAF